MPYGTLQNRKIIFPNYNMDDEAAQWSMGYSESMQKSSGLILGNSWLKFLASL